MITVCDIDVLTGYRDSLERFEPESVSEACLVAYERIKGWCEPDDCVVEQWGYMDKSQRPGIVLLVECADGDVCDNGIQIIGERP